MLGRGGLTASRFSVAGGELIPTFTAALSRIGEGGAPEGLWLVWVCGFPP